MLGNVKKYFPGAWYLDSKGLDLHNGG